MNSKRRESAILTDILLRLGRMPHICRIWRTNSGALYDRDGRLIHFGFPGCADILGIMRGGRFLAIEVKSATGRLSADQESFRRMIEEFGGVWVVARSADDAVRGVEAAMVRGAAA